MNTCVQYLFVSIIYKFYTDLGFFFPRNVSFEIDVEIQQEKMERAKRKNFVFVICI